MGTRTCRFQRQRGSRHHGETHSVVRQEDSTARNSNTDWPWHPTSLPHAQQAEVVRMGPPGSERPDIRGHGPRAAEMVAESNRKEGGRPLRVRGSAERGASTKVQPGGGRQGEDGKGGVGAGSVQGSSGFPSVISYVIGGT